MVTADRPGGGTSDGIKAVERAGLVEAVMGEALDGQAAHPAVGGWSALEQAAQVAQAVGVARVMAGHVPGAVAVEAPRAGDKLCEED